MTSAALPLRPVTATRLRVGPRRAWALGAIALVISFLAGSMPLGALTTAPSANELYVTAYEEALTRHVRPLKDGTVYVSTGDIDAEWLRDAGAVGLAYAPRAREDKATAKTLRGIIAGQAKYLTIDPYANAFSVDGRVVERKFELDSLLYPVWLAHAYWKATGDRSIFTNHERAAFDRLLAVMRTEQQHAQRSDYRHPDLARNGRGSPVAYTGMVWTGFRPSDDPATYHYNVPENMLAVVALRKLSEIESKVYRNTKQAANAWGLAIQIERGIRAHAIVNVKGLGSVYAYEVDGLGHSAIMDDANVPSLLSIPYLGYAPMNDPLYARTRKLVLSNRNPYYYSGKIAKGIGSPHTARNYVWPLALVMQAFTSTSPAETTRVLSYLVASDTGDHRLHESFDADQPSAYTRGDFAWPNALYAELIAAQREAGTL